MATAAVRGKQGVQRIRPTKRVVERIDPDEDFSDVIGNDVTRFSLENERPDRKYAWPEATPEDMSRFQSGELGIRYVVEKYQGDDVADALRPMGSLGLLKAGDPIRVGSHICMSVDKALWQKRKRLEAKNTYEANVRNSARRQGDTIAGEHASEWAGLEDYRSQGE